MLRKLFFAVSATLALFISANAQEDSTKSVVISGNVDAYYRYNFDGGTRFANNNTSFTNSQSSFELGMASIRADLSALSGKVGAVIDLGFGRRAEEFSYMDGDDDQAKNGFISLSNIKQAYITYQPISALKFTAGKFATHVGYELLDAPLNRNYSMSYMFTNGPFFHTGLKADITAGPVGFMVGVANATDMSTRYVYPAVPVTSVKGLIGQFSGSFLDSKLKFYLNYAGFFGSKSGNNALGLKSLNQVDLVLLGTISDKFNIGYNGTLQSRTPTAGDGGSWIGNALYLNFDPSSAIGLTLRSEYIMDDDGVLFTTAPTENIFANTLSLNWKVGPLTIIPELRYETAEAEIFVKKNEETTKSTFSALLAAVIKF